MNSNSIDTDLAQKLSDPKRRACVDNKYALNKVGRKNWNIISGNTGNSNDLLIWRNMYDIGRKNQTCNQPIKSLVFCGEDIYQSIRGELITKGIVIQNDNEVIVSASKTTIKNKVKPTRKANLIKQDNFKRIVIKNDNDEPMKKTDLIRQDNSKRVVIQNDDDEVNVPASKTKTTIKKADLIRQDDDKVNVPTSKTKTTIKNKVKPMKKADLIRQENTLKKFKTDLDILHNSLLTEPVISKNIVFNAKFVELVLARMMIHCKQLCLKITTAITMLNAKSSSKYAQKEELVKLADIVEMHKTKLIEMIVGYNKIISEKRVNPTISQTCISDLDKWISYAKRLINFDVSEVIVKMPGLIFNTVYDGMLEKKQYGLYPSQKEIFEFVTSTDKYLALLHTMLGSGKTSMILPICGWLSSNRKTCGTKLVFCCPNEVVVWEVANMIYGMAASFAVVVRDKNDGSLEYKWSSFADKKNPDDTCVLYLCDIFVARMLMEQRMEAVESNRLYMLANRRDPINYPLTESRIPHVPDYILMGDELTKDADSQNGFMVDSNFSITTEIFVELMKVAPPKIILMSATLPTAVQLPDFYNHIVSNNPGMILKSFASSEAKIGCALISNTGQLFAPHIGCDTVADVQNVLNVIKTNPFIGRFYTFQVLLDMVSRFKSHSIQTPDITVMFDNPDKANQTNIQQTAYSMLNSLIAVSSDDVVKQVCVLNKNVGNAINLDTILTTDFGRFSKGCLVFSSDPVATAFKVYHSNFDKFMDPNAERDIFKQVRLDTVLAKYQREVELWTKALKRIEDKSDSGIIKQNKENDKKEKVKTESWQTTANMNDKKPTWEFPAMIQLCSEEHLVKTNHHLGTGSGGIIGPDDLPENTSVSIEILTMLASGIGIYSTTSPMLDDDYLKTVLLLAKKGLVKIIFTDSSIAYGTNLAVSDIIIIDEPVISSNNTPISSITEKHSMKTIFQMLGRAGRGGNLSYEARVYTTSPNNELIENIKMYVRGCLDEGTKDEITNIHRAYKVLWEI